MQEPKGIDAFADTKRLIVIAAHPDDLETMCGGTIIQLIQRGVTVFSINCTLGDIGTQDAAMYRTSLASIRLQETENAAHLLGIAASYNLGHHDGELLADLNLRAQIARLYRLTQADTLLTFDPYWTEQRHPDHRAAGQAALDACMPARMPLYHPEQLNEPGTAVSQVERAFLFATEREPDVWVDITAVYDTKLAACRAHTSQFPQGNASLEWMRERDGKRGARIQSPYAESFRQMRV